jgi:hypothetical protein
MSLLRTRNQSWLSLIWLSHMAQPDPYFQHLGTDNSLTDVECRGICNSRTSKERGLKKCDLIIAAQIKTPLSAHRLSLIAQRRESWRSLSFSPASTEYGVQTSFIVEVGNTLSVCINRGLPFLEGVTMTKRHKKSSKNYLWHLFWTAGRIPTLHALRGHGESPASGIK